MNYIWDLDGTLIDSYGVIVSSLADVAENVGANGSEEEILREVKRGSVSGYLRQLSERTGADYDGLYREYRRISHERDEAIVLMPGAVSTLRGLRDRGASHFLYTHRGGSTGRLLERLGLAEYFREVITWEAGFPAKPSGDAVRWLVNKYGLDPKQTAYVGDRAIDVGCAKDAGVLAVLLMPADSCVSPTGEEDLIIMRLEDLFM